MDQNQQDQVQQDVDSLVAGKGISDKLDRRSFLQATVGTGFAAAVMPVCAQTAIKTAADGIAGGGSDFECKRAKNPSLSRSTCWKKVFCQ